jgi:uncharacterized membrane protein YccC
MFQLNALAGNDEAARRDTLRWLFSTLEVGNAALDLRHELVALPAHPRYAKDTAWRDAIEATLKALAALFEQPRASRYATALDATGAAIEKVQALLQDFEPPREERHPLQRILSQLHFIRTALIDPQSPLAALAGDEPARQDVQGVPHAS